VSSDDGAMGKSIGKSVGDGGSGAQAVEHEPFLSKYFALPHVQDPTTNPTFADLFALDPPTALTQARDENNHQGQITSA
jgi:hypothetical protein